MLDILHILCLQSLLRLKPADILRLITSRVGPPSGASDLTVWLNGQGVGVFTKAEVTQAQEKAQHIVNACQRQSIHLIGYGDLLFPERLKRIPHPPLLLYVKGDLACLQQEPGLALIGTRAPSARGFSSAKKMATHLAQQGYVIVSGLALGCDTAAHQGALEGQGKTIAILAHGLDTIYPKENQTLASKIVTSGGCLISEYPPGTKADKAKFVQRNRLQSGLSLAVIIIECALQSGTLHTASFAKAQGKSIACLMYESDVLHAFPQIDISGNQSLIAQGATPFYDKAQLESFLEPLSSKKKVGA